jgi:hypothetical protein
MDRRGHIYVLENTTDNPFPTPNTGKVVRIDGKNKIHRYRYWTVPTHCNDVGT